MSAQRMPQGICKGLFDFVLLTGSLIQLLQALEARYATQVYAWSKTSAHTHILTYHALQ